MCSHLMLFSHDNKERLELLTSKESSSGAWATYLLMAWAAAIAGIFTDDSSWTSRGFPLVSV